MRQEESESLEDFADHVLVKAAEGYPEVPDATLQTLATDNFLRGCKDRSAAYVAVEKKPKDLQSAVQVVREAAVNLKLYGRSGAWWPDRSHLRIVTRSMGDCLTGTLGSSDLWSSSWRSYSSRRGKQVINARRHRRLSAVVHHHWLVVISVRSQVIEPGTAIKSHSVSNAVSRVIFQPSVVAGPLRG